MLALGDGADVLGEGIKGVGRNGEQPRQVFIFSSKEGMKSQLYHGSTLDGERN